MQLKETNGFSLIEIIIVMGIVGIMSAIAVPSFLSRLPEIRLKAAARELYSNLQKARLQAVKDNQVVRVRFSSSPPTPGFYYVDDDNNNNWDAGERRVDLANHNDVDLGNVTVVRNWKNELCSSGNCNEATLITFQPIGTALPRSVYLQNINNPLICYAVTSQTSGAIKIRRYDGNSWR